MYAFVDRPLHCLEEKHIWLTLAMRSWIWACDTQRCPIAAIGPAFMRVGRTDCLAPFHRFMSLLNREAMHEFGFGPPPCPSVTEGEAILLALFNTDPARVPALLDLIFHKNQPAIAIDAIHAIRGLLTTSL